MTSVTSEHEDADHSYELESVTELESNPGKPFQFYGQKLLLTYSEHVDKPSLAEHIEDVTGFKPKWLRSAHETGETGHEHTHCLIDFGKRVKYSKCDKFDMEVVHEDDEDAEDAAEHVVYLHPNWRPIKTKGHWDHCVKYLSKEDPENADLAGTPVNIIQAVWNQPTRAEAILKFAESPAQAQAIITLYDARPSLAPEISPPEAWWPWQDEVLSLIKTRPDDRTVHWFIDPEGAKGKSRLAKFLTSQDLAYMVRTTGGDKDFATIVRGALANGWNQRCWIFDLPRVSEAHAIYGPIEAMKDGCVTATKYAGGTSLFEQPHVLVFANFAPDVTKLSADRWRIHRIREDKTLDKPIFRRDAKDARHLPQRGTDTAEADPTPGGLNIIGPPAPSSLPRPDNVGMTDTELDELVDFWDTQIKDPDKQWHKMTREEKTAHLTDVSESQHRRFIQDTTPRTQKWTGKIIPVDPSFFKKN